MRHWDDKSTKYTNSKFAHLEQNHEPSDNFRKQWASSKKENTLAEINWVEKGFINYWEYQILKKEPTKTTK